MLVTYNSIHPLQSPGHALLNNQKTSIAEDGHNVLRVFSAIPCHVTFNPQHRCSHRLKHASSAP